MKKFALWCNWSLTFYLWVIDLFSLGNWNYQTEPHLISFIFNKGQIGIGDISFLFFVTLPAIIFSLGYFLKNIWLILISAIVDVIWIVLQILSWWIPYAFGTNKQWQLNYAKGRTTKILPSFGNHIAPDGMHFVISILLIATIFFTINYILLFKKEFYHKNKSA